LTDSPERQRVEPLGVLRRKLTTIAMSALCLKIGNAQVGVYSRPSFTISWNQNCSPL
jgi:hypothetical protein